jgi:8-amino-3,8-dideoxy-alpha-D-manno-octulosonate transaminase
MPGRELIGEDELAAVTKVFTTGGVLCSYGFEGERAQFAVRAFEEAMRSWLGVRYALAVSSGTAALKVALDALDIGPGDEVITQSFTMVATVESILATGAKPVITEIDEGLCMSPADLADHLTDRTRAIVPVHMLGGPADLQAIRAVAEQAGVPVIEDAAQALGARIGNRPVGTTSQLGIYSFDYFKTITTGEGGMVVTSRDDLFTGSRAAHDHGHDYRPDLPRYRDTHSRGGFNFRMSELQGAVGLAQVAKVEQVLDQQRRNWELLASHLPAQVTLRRLPAGGVQTHDTLTMVLADPTAAKEVLTLLTEHDLPTWTVPASTSWHFAGEWDHLFPGMVRSRFPTSSDILDRTVAVHVPVRLEPALEERWSRAWQRG